MASLAYRSSSPGRGSGVTNQPYRFLRNYEFNEEDSKVFFGREREAAALIAEITNRHLVILFAPTGTGKSSLINAAVRPKLEKRGYKTLYVPPKNDPEEAIMRELAKESLLKPGTNGLAQTLREAKELAGKPLVLFLDQFEEFFIYLAHDRPDRVPLFIKEIAELYRDRASGIHFLFSLREDFFVEMDVFRDEIPTMFQANSSLRLRAFDTEAARKAIEEPARRFGVRYLKDATCSDDTETNREKNKEFVDRLLSDLQVPWAILKTGPPGRISPIHLQIVCDTLWRSRTGDVIDEATYKDLGGVRIILRRRFQTDFAGSLDNEELILFERLMPLLRSDHRGTKRVLPVAILAGQLVADEARAANLVQKLISLRLLHQGSYGTIEWASDYLSGQCEQLLVDVRSIRTNRSITQAMQRASEPVHSVDSSGRPMPPGEQELEARFMKLEEFREISGNCEDLLRRAGNGPDALSDVDFQLTPGEVKFLFEAALEHADYLEFWNRKSGAESIGILREKILDPAARSSQTLSAIRLIASLRTPQALEILRGILANESWTASAAAAELGRYGDDDVIVLLKEYIHSHPPAAIEAMLMSRDWSTRAKVLLEIPSAGAKCLAGPSSAANGGQNQPGAASTYVDWKLLVKLIGDGRLVPVIGMGTLSRNMAEALAKAVDYPGEERDLAVVAEFAEWTHSRPWLREFIADFVAKQQTSADTTALAELPLTVFITTRFDTKLLEALRANGRNPRLASWDLSAGGVQWRGLDARPSPDSPLIYQLNGSLDSGSVVLTTSDQFHFVSSCAASADAIPLRIRAMFARGNPIFLDFEPGTPELRIVASVFRTIRALADRADGYLAPARDANSNLLSQAMLKLDAYNLGLRPYGGSTQQFVAQLVSEWRSMSHA